MMRGYPLRYCILDRSDEAPAINKLHAWVAEQGYRFSGQHHEVYMSDPRRTKPEKLKTIIRHPVEKMV